MEFGWEDTYLYDRDTGILIGHTHASHMLLVG